MLPCRNKRRDSPLGIVVTLRGRSKSSEYSSPKGGILPTLGQELVSYRKDLGGISVPRPSKL
jgi:hypothetical protein